MREPDGLGAILAVVKKFYETGIDDHFFVFILLILIVADVITGFCKAWALKNFSSRKARTGIVTHSAIFVITAIGYPFFLFANAGSIADMIITALCASYGASLVTNLDILGMRIPYITTFINERVDNHKRED